MTPSLEYSVPWVHGCSPFRHGSMTALVHLQGVRLLIRYTSRRVLSCHAATARTWTLRSSSPPPSRPASTSTTTACCRWAASCGSCLQRCEMISLYQQSFRQSGVARAQPLHCVQTHDTQSCHSCQLPVHFAYLPQLLCARGCLTHYAHHVCAHLASCVSFQGQQALACACLV